MKKFLVKEYYPGNYELHIIKGSTSPKIIYMNDYEITGNRINLYKKHGDVRGKLVASYDLGNADLELLN